MIAITFYHLISIFLSFIRFIIKLVIRNAQVKRKLATSNMKYYETWPDFVKKLNPCQLDYFIEIIEIFLNFNFYTFLGILRYDFIVLAKISKIWT